MMNSRNKAFSLVEVLASLFIVCVMVAVLTVIYQSSRQALAAVDERLDSGFFSSEVMQLIVEDIDKLSASDSDSSLQLQSKLVGGGVVYRLEIINKIYDNDGKEVEYRKVIWQSDYDSLTQSYTLYRCYSGMSVEDPVLSTQAREFPDSDIFVPVCEGLTYFTISVPKIQQTQQGQEVEYLDRWEEEGMPGGLVVELSFAPAVEYVTGEVEVPVEKRLMRTIAVNRARDYGFEFVAKNLVDEYGELVTDAGEDVIDDEDFEENPTDQESSEAENKEDEDEK